MGPPEQRSRQEFWEYYRNGVNFLSWTALYMYQHRFGNSMSWDTVSFQVYDYDAIGNDDFMGAASVQVVETSLTSVDLSGDPGSKDASITYSIDWCPCPPGSRLKGFWRVYIEKAEGLPAKDRSGLSDPYITVVGHSDSAQIDHITCVKPQCLNPTWNETFELPVAAESGALDAALEIACAGLSSGNYKDLMRKKGNGNYHRQSSHMSRNFNKNCSGFGEWVKRIDSQSP